MLTALQTTSRISLSGERPNDLDLVCFFICKRSELRLFRRAWLRRDINSMSNNPDTFATQICATLTPPPPPSLAPRIAHEMRTQIQAHLRAAQEGDDPPVQQCGCWDVRAVASQAN